MSFSEPYQIKYKEIGNQNLDADLLKKYLSGTEIGKCFNSIIDPVAVADGSSIQFLNESISRITSKLTSGDKLYLSNDEILNGIHPHHAAVTKKMLPMLPEGTKVGTGIFILSNEEVEALEIPECERKLLHPYYDTNNIGRFYFDSNNQYSIIYTSSEFKDITLMDEFPTIREHLDGYVTVITSDNRPYGLHRARKQEFFENNVIASLRKCQKPTFSYIDVPAYLTAEWYLIMTNRVDMRYLTCLLNSTLIKFWLLKMGKMQVTFVPPDSVYFCFKGVFLCF